MGGGMMRIFSAALLMLVHALVVSRPTSGAAVDRYESDRQQHTVINFMDTTKDRRAEGESTSATTVEHGQGGEEEYDDEYYYEDEYEDGISGDYDMGVPRVSKSSQPKDPSAILETESIEGKRRRGKGRKRAKGKGQKRNPCLKKYKDFCIHGTCQYHRNIRQPACVCHPNYSGERCEFITLPVQSPEGYNRTTALAVVAVVLSSVCLTIIGLLLMLRFHKRGAYDVENEEKVKLGLASNH
ncbi:heparin-binding EGF-like growth factor a [Hippoglossus hippoglossus]|uniref:heparin-binding EGF-like growth factor a n=1 Tax=Hippoglossus hippoglossus TaxID=8267 RepID=UPI00148D8484|nr:heparin-binding EGF-like growth factor a [Hippoglossus hippoglossus]XP_034454779.1 heparin-binding EGF-like growth factor a [Hippoglossus hippoglossus]XP_035016633.1 heparin-binding EGF-like growth factor a [Hippoglossus stenolepis]